MPRTARRNARNPYSGAFLPLSTSLCLLQAFLSHAQCCRMAAELRTTVCSTMSLKSIEPRTLISLPTELLTLVAEELDLHGLARFADACKGCLAAAHGELRAALRTAVRLCLEPGAGPVSDARTSRQGEGAARGTGKRRHQLAILVACPYFHFPDDLVDLPDDCFRGATLTKLILPAGLATIGYGAFWNSSLSSLTFPETLTATGKSSCYRCTSLLEVSLPPTLTTISDGSFYGCVSISSIVLPLALTTIGSKSFFNCASLKELTLPPSLTTIGGFAFAGCSSLAELALPSTALTTIGRCAFYRCSALTSLALPATLTILGDCAFHGCSSLVEITVPASLTTIGYVAPDARAVPLSPSPTPPPPASPYWRRRLPRWLPAPAR